LEELKTGSERRTAKRESGDDLLAFFWDGDVPKGHRVRDISRRGAYVETEFSWTQGTFILLTLQIVRQSNVKGKAKTDPEDSIAITAEVVRIVPGGMGLRFRLTDLEDVRSFLKFLLRWKPEAFPTPSGKRAVQS